jgi:hypothetical protein
MMWQRKDISKIQYIKIDTSNENIYIGTEMSSMVVMQLHSGIIIDKIKVATKIFFDPLSSKTFLLLNQNQVVGEDINIMCPTFAFLDVLPIGTGIVLSAAKGELFYHDYSQHKICWQIKPRDKEHFIKIAFSKKANTIYAILYKYDNNRNEPQHYLVGISANNGCAKFAFPLPLESCEYGFACHATKIICSSGEVYDISGIEPKQEHKYFW